MSVHFTAPLNARPVEHEGLRAASIDLHAAGLTQSPVVMLDDFHVSGHPFGPHPHAGFSAVTYVFPDSAARLRSRDSLGNDIIVGAGGIVWSETAGGMMHEEIAEGSGELHGVQFFVNLGRQAKSAPARVMALEGQAVPVWQNDRGDAVRVVVGAYGKLVSPLIPIEPAKVLDLHVEDAIDLEMGTHEIGLLYVRSGTVEALSDIEQVGTASGAAIMITGAGLFSVRAECPSDALFLSGGAIPDSVVRQGPFIMNDDLQIAAAVQRYQAGEMGRLRALHSSPDGESL